jgi:glycogen debranching enzyme
VTVAVPRSEAGETGTVSPFYISSSVAVPSYRPRVLKQGDAFAVFDHFGDAQATAPGSEGLFFEDTRHLAQWALTIAGVRPLLLSSLVTDDNSLLSADLANPDLNRDGALWLARDTVHIRRSIVLGEDALFERLALRNFGIERARFDLALNFDVDFADIFEVRGTIRARRGTKLRDVLQDDGLTIAYRGLDSLVRRTRFVFAPLPELEGPRRAVWTIGLAPGETRTIDIEVRCEHAGSPQGPASRAGSLAAAAGRITDRQQRAVDLYSSNESFNDWVGRSRADLDMLITATPHGLYAYAGIPWFSTAFGRDGLITALQCLWLDPSLARGTLQFLAAKQATAVDPKVDSEPGKILHETRRGEMAALGEVPFGCYYGSVDSTPLFVVLAAAYYDRTGDIAFSRMLWPSVERALAWMSEYGDLDDDGFLEYDRHSVNGLINQGWKDSSDAIFHADGSLAKAPIALAEVQAYAYAAYRGAARLAAALEFGHEVARLEKAAERLRQRFEAAFWLDDIGTYALALDRAKRPCKVRSSNAGQVLFGGLAAPERAAAVAATLMQAPSFSGWGIRTIAEGEARYSPISYHNGSIWPHDNGLIAMGFARYGLREPLHKLFTGMFDTALFMDLKRMPELFCGFARQQHGTGPTAYPVACLPQAWASATVFALLGASLGISFDAAARQIRFQRPMLPSWLDELRLTNLRLGDASVDLLLRRSGDDVAVHLLRRAATVEIVVTT